MRRAFRPGNISAFIDCVDDAGDEMWLEVRANPGLEPALSVAFGQADRQIAEFDINGDAYRQLLSWLQERSPV